MPPESTLRGLRGESGDGLRADGSGGGVWHVCCHDCTFEELFNDTNALSESPELESGYAREDHVHQTGHDVSRARIDTSTELRADDGQIVLDTLGDAPICPGCGLVAHITHGDVCSECFRRREHWQGGGGLRVVALDDADADVHTDPTCPEFSASPWRYWRDESALYYTMSDRNTAGYCPACTAYSERHSESVATDGGGENPTELPEDHPLGDYNGVLDDHASHLEALGDYLRSAHPGEVQSLMLVLTTSEPATETIPSMHEDADVEQMVWHQLAAHLSHVAHAFNTSPEAAAKHACHVLHDQQGPVDLRTSDDEDLRADGGQEGS